MTEACASLPARKSFSWDFFSFLIFLIVVSFQISSWYKFPLFLDDYYHLSVVRGFVQAGGWVGEAFWEYAPVGRPHLYPPLWHLFECGLHFSGFNLITVARLSNVLIYPLFLWTGWYLVRKQTRPNLAFWTLFFLVSSESLYLSVINNIPFSLAFCFGLCAFDAYRDGRFFSASVAMAASFYTHALVFWLFFAGMLVWGVWDKEERKTIWKILLVSFLLGLPLFIHQIRFLSFVHLVKPPDYYYFNLDPLLAFLAFSGLCLSVRQTGFARFILVLVVVFLVLFETHRSRYLSGQVLYFFAFFAALAVDHFIQKCRPKLLPLALVVLIFAVQILGVQMSWDPLAKKTSWVWLDTPFIYWAGGREASQAGIKAETIFYPKWIGQCVGLVKKHSAPGDILYSNFDYAGGMVAVLADRPTSTAMLSEVGPFRPFDQAGAARWILWFKDENPDSVRLRDILIRGYGWEEAGETEIAFLFSNPRTAQKERTKTASVPFAVCYFVVLAAVAVMIWEGCFPRKAG